jgi:hypothetical protein
MMSHAEVLTNQIFTNHMTCIQTYLGGSLISKQVAEAWKNGKRWKLAEITNTNTNTNMTK